MIVITLACWTLVVYCKAQVLNGFYWITSMYWVYLCCFCTKYSFGNSVVVVAAAVTAEIFHLAFRVREREKRYLFTVDCWIIRFCIVHWQYCTESNVCHLTEPQYGVSFSWLKLRKRIPSLFRVRECNPYERIHSTDSDLDDRRCDHRHTQIHTHTFTHRSRKYAQIQFIINKLFMF